MLSVSQRSNASRCIVRVEGRVPLDGLAHVGEGSTMSASRRRPTSRFQPGMAAMQARTGASPSALAIWGLAPARRAGFVATKGSLLLVAVDRLPLPAAPFEFDRGGLPLLGRFRLARTVEGDGLANERRE